MNNATDNLKLQLEALDAAAGRSPRKLFALSPNDVLVQISLPLVLILAIATRLMIIGQGLAALDGGPAIMDLWKQQLMTRIDRAADAWETESGIRMFPDFQRVFWTARRPADPAFQKLCVEAQALNDMDAMHQKIYRQALSYRPSAADAPADAAADLRDIFDIFDPTAGITFPGAEDVPERFRIDDARRAFAMDYIGQRCRKWRDHVAYLQWSALDRIAAEMRLDDPMADSRLTAQMAKVAAEMSRLGYPLLANIVNEFQHHE